MFGRWHVAAVKSVFMVKNPEESTPLGGTYNLYDTRNSEVDMKLYGWNAYLFL